MQHNFEEELSALSEYNDLLNSCPFCGSFNTCAPRASYSYTTKGECLDCGTVEPFETSDSKGKFHKEKMRWNQRVDINRDKYTNVRLTFDKSVDNSKIQKFIKTLMEEANKLGIIVDIKDK